MNSKYLSKEQLFNSLTENGFRVDLDFINYLPALWNKEGMLIKGEIDYSGRYDLKAIQKMLRELESCNVFGQLRERGIIADPYWERYFPREKIDGKYSYDIERIVAFVNTTNGHNLRAKLKERGYDFSEAEYSHVYEYLSDFKEKDEKGYTSLNLEKIISYLNSVNDYNIDAKLKERGYDIDARLKWAIRISRETKLKDQGYECYDLDKVIAYIEKKIGSKIKDMNKIMNAKDAIKDEEKDFKLDQLFSPLVENYSHFPITKWYVKKYGVAPDINFIGRVNINELLKDTSLKILWYYKGIQEYSDDSANTPQFLRVLEYERYREYIKEALIEIEDGMYLMLVDGAWNWDTDNIVATLILYYKEGIHDPTELLKEVSDDFIVHNISGTLGLLFHSDLGFETGDYFIQEPTIDFKLNYNEGFEKVHNTIFKELKNPHGKGLVLLHGAPGTGKTTYIRYLINKIDKNKIFVPPNLTELLSNPGFVPFLMNNPNCILFIEDAEVALRSRDDGKNNQAVSNILNITDGLLSDCLNIQIVATFNTNVQNIDPALLRKGRLIAQYEFKELELDRAEKLADSLNVWIGDSEHLTVANIYAAKKRN